MQYSRALKDGALLTIDHAGPNWEVDIWEPEQSAPRYHASYPRALDAQADALVAIGRYASGQVII